MGLLADQSARWVEMGRAGIELVKPHSLEQTIEKYTTIYIQLLEGGPGLDTAAAIPVTNRGPEIAHRSGRP